MVQRKPRRRKEEVGSRNGEGLNRTGGGLRRGGAYSDSCLLTSISRRDIKGRSPCASVFANELVAFQRGGDLKSRGRLKAVVRGFSPQHLADTAEVNRLRSIVIEGNDVFDGAAKIRLSLRGEQHSGGTDVPGEPTKRDPFGAGAGNRERQP